MEPLDYAPELRHNPLKPNKKRAEIAVYIFWGIVGLSAISVFSSFLQFNLLNAVKEGILISDSDADFNDMREAVIGALEFIISIASIFAFLYWFRRAYGNVSRTKIMQTEHEETWAIWSFMIPIISLWYPYKIMKEIWGKSQKITQSINPEYKIDYNTTHIGVWWAAYLISNVMGQVSFRLALEAETLDELINMTLVQATCGMIEIPAALVTLVVIKNVSKKEDDLYQAMSTMPVQKEENINTGENN